MGNMHEHLGIVIIEGHHLLGIWNYVWALVGTCRRLYPHKGDGGPFIFCLGLGTSLQEYEEE